MLIHPMRPPRRGFLLALLALLIAIVAAAAWLTPGTDFSPSRRVVSESQAGAVLRHGLAAAQAQARREKLADADRDGSAEHLTLAELVSRGLMPMPTAPAPSGELIHGAYRYSVFLPDGADGGGTVAAETPAAIDGRERHFVAYAWPADATSTWRRFAIDERGELHAHESVPGAPAPAWNSLYGGKTWGAEPAAPWKPYRK